MAFASQAEILSNPGFDTYQASGVATSWTGTGGTFSQDTSNPHDPGGSDQKVVTTGTSGELLQTFSLNKGVVYHGSVWLRTSSGNHQVTFYLQLGNGVQQHAIFTTTIGTTWQQVVINGGFQDSGTGNFIIDFLDNATYFVDDASLTDVTTSYMNAPLENAGVTTPSTLVGLVINKLQSTDWPPINQGVVRLWDTGTRWSQIELTTNAFTWGHLDDWVNHIRTNDSNCKIMYTMGQTPPWANGNQDETFPPNNMVDWSNYVWHVATRYNTNGGPLGVVRDFEVWNEWDSPSYYHGSVAQMVTMATLAKEIITTVNPANVLHAPVVTLGGFQKIQSYIQSGGDAVTDIYGYHNYPNAIVEQSLGNIIGFKDMLTNNGVSKPLWCTEGAPQVIVPNEGYTTNQGIASRVYLMFWAQNVQSYDWYQWDGAVLNGNLTNVGLTINGKATNVASAAGAAVSMLATNWLGGSKPVFRITDAKGTWQFAVQQPSTPTNYIVWNPYSNAVFNIPSGWHISQSRDFSNHVTSLAGATTMTATITPVILDSTNSAANNPPTCTITNPADGTAYGAPANVTYKASAADSDGTIANVIFLMNGTQVAQVFSSPYNFTTNGLTQGIYHMKAVATDNGGLSTTSSVVDITVSNLPPLAAWFPLEEGAVNITTNQTHAGAGGYTGYFSNSPSWIVTGLPSVPPAEGGTVAAVNFNATGSADPYIITTYPGVLSNSARTIAAWIYASNSQPNNASFLSYGDGGSTGHRMTLRLDTTNTFGLRVEVQGAAAVGSTPLNNAAWHHVAMTFPAAGTVSSILLYVDGNPETVTAIGGTTVVNTTNINSGEFVMLGNSDVNTTTYGFNGSIDDVRFYTNVLTAVQIQQLAFGSNPHSVHTQLPVPISYSQQNGNLTMSWAGTWVLQMNTALDGDSSTWVDVPGATSPYTVPLQSQGTEFFRLRSP